MGLAAMETELLRLSDEEVATRVQCYLRSRSYPWSEINKGVWMSAPALWDHVCFEKSYLHSNQCLSTGDPFILRQCYKALHALFTVQESLTREACSSPVRDLHDLHLDEPKSPADGQASWDDCGEEDTQMGELTDGWEPAHRTGDWDRSRYDATYWDDWDRNIYEIDDWDDLDVSESYDWGENMYEAGYWDGYESHGSLDSE